MNRVINFRGKRIGTKEWVYGYYYAECGNTYIFENRQAESMTKRNIIIRVTEDNISQYTGCKDINGAEVYEGDIVQFDGIMLKVIYDETLASFVLIHIDNSFKCSTPLGEMLKFSPFEIVGNCWDNPELLEGEGL